MDELCSCAAGGVSVSISLTSAMMRVREIAAADGGCSVHTKLGFPEVMAGL